MDKSQILDHFALLAGLDSTEACRYSALADGIIAQVSGMLRKAVCPKENAVRLTALCGALCYYQYTLQQESATEESIRALNVSVTRKSPGRQAGAAAIRNEAMLAAKALLRDDGFFCE